MTKGPPKIVPAGEISEETRRAAYELIAQALRENTDMLNLTIADVTYAGKPIGAYEISIRKLD